MVFLKKVISSDSNFLEKMCSDKIIEASTDQLSAFPKPLKLCTFSQCFKVVRLASAINMKDILQALNTKLRAYGFFFHLADALLT